MAEIANLFAQAAPGAASFTATSATSNMVSPAQAGKTTFTLEVRDGGSWVVGTGTIQVSARIAGSGKMDTVIDWAIAGLSYFKLDTTTGSKVAGTTAITAVGLYEFDITNLEVAVVWTKGNSTGTVILKGAVSNSN